ncbi:hypothetical protein M513_06285 [Trichuris suis]|uniref:Uncharacterized protein n=1 Tax=Trichuris suis TaxID=68888 RepID=A0A085M6E8_9BILA|nr:hypothetical protein M513_06285 [Trichuris suis]
MEAMSLKGITLLPYASDVLLIVGWAQSFNPPRWHNPRISASVFFDGTVPLHMGSFSDSTVLSVSRLFAGCDLEVNTSKCAPRVLRDYGALDSKWNERNSCNCTHRVFCCESEYRFVLMLNRRDLTIVLSCGSVKGYLSLLRINSSLFSR